MCVLLLLTPYFLPYKNPVIISHVFTVFFLCVLLVQAVNLGREAQYFPLHYQTRYQSAKRILT